MVDDHMMGPTAIGPLERFSDAWLECLRRVMKAGRDVDDDGRGLRELLNVSVAARTCDMGDFLEEGADEARIRLMERKYHSIGVVPPYRMSYGSLFRSHDGIDQVAWLVQRLQAKKYAKSATIGFHVPGCDELSCISLYDCKVRAGQLHVNVVYRSQNVFGSQPGNVVALSKFQVEIARILGVETGMLTLHVLSAHVYHSDFSDVREIVGQ